MNCRNCFYFPCFKNICNIGNKQGCEDYKSIVTKEIEKIDLRNDAYEKKQ